MKDKRIPHRLLFNGKYVMVEEPVQFLIGVVNTELLKAVCLKENVRQIYLVSKEPHHSSLIGSVSDL